MLVFRAWLSFFQNRHAGTFRLNYHVTTRNIIQCFWTYITSEIIDLLGAAIFQSHFLAVEVVGITLAVCV
ncbi:MAG: hypothetical protein UX38_C0001G0089 [Microgenomates group bacterium GW2011_GWC1_46_16]|nr:MAG: hypothetical protein UX38_C0001G0089 [Microgenomates group bacterium GW2011_GWC1_46_16]KKU27869.1 MAG: hypothetical protein UX40_C0005G0022 [Microgenomates group bacterium GW2011_GWF2_46_18]